MPEDSPVGTTFRLGWMTLCTCNIEWWAKWEQACHIFVQRFALGRLSEAFTVFHFLLHCMSKWVVLATGLETKAMNHSKPTTLTKSADKFWVFCGHSVVNLCTAPVLPLTPSSLIVLVLWSLGWDGSPASCFSFLFLNLIIFVLQELHSFSVEGDLNSTWIDRNVYVDVGPMTR